jgi:hypothetical protein
MACELQNHEAPVLNMTSTGKCPLAAEKKNLSPSEFWNAGYGVQHCIYFPDNCKMNAYIN